MTKLSHFSDVDALRKEIRRGTFTSSTAGLSSGYVQANFVALPRVYALDFLLWCIRNPRPCPIIEVLDDGRTTSDVFLNNLDIRVDIPLYRFFSKNALERELLEIREVWRPDLYTFLLGCSFTLDDILIDSGLPVRHVDENSVVPMYITQINTIPAGLFSGPVVVTMRPMKKAQALKAARITASYNFAHGAPISIGGSSQLGIGDLGSPDFGEPVTVCADEIPVFWACGVTTQVAIANAKLEFAISHAPGRMLITSVHTKDAHKKLDSLKEYHP
uniref:Uncharacterized protein YcsI, UPF0317 family n=1 Tax=Candidatus Kentrum sp. LFY TaxID=2126342 RepID=A0A450WWX3_9GAMM|nr:MAG: Uncharacterized protein YcsI, UPF0317 family [Candidatus Kentron sp. LFY]